MADFWKGPDSIWQQLGHTVGQVGDDIGSAAQQFESNWNTGYAAGENSPLTKKLDQFGGALPFVGGTYSMLRDLMSSKKGGPLTPEEEEMARKYSERMDGANQNADRYSQGFQDNLNDIKGLSDPNSAYYKQSMAGATNAAGRAAGNAGIRGGLSVANTENAALSQANNIRLQQLQLQGQGLTAGGQFAQGQQNFAAQQQARNQQINYQNAQAKYQRNQQNGLGSLFGLTGAIGGGVLGGAVGGAGGVQAGAQAGVGLGTGFGNTFTSGMNTPPKYGDNY